MSVLVRAWRASLVVMAVTALASPEIVHARPCWEPPVDAPVTDPFRPPACRWCPGNRGIEFGTPAGFRVRAVATGRVTFAGPVAGTFYVVVRHGDGRRVTYANLDRPAFDVDDLVVRGQTVGRTAGRLHLGVRVGGRYVDPTPMLGRWVFRARLVPSDGGPGNPPPPARLTCRRPPSV